MGRDEAIWSLDSHSLGKHLVLKRYLEAWFPILAGSSRRIVFVDGFAGPGRYEGGEDGSPLVALKTFLQSRVRENEATFVFIEEDRQRVRLLTDAVGGLFKPKTLDVRVIQGRFDENMSEVLTLLRQQGLRSAPVFVMVDPFGVSHTPMRTLGEILRNKAAEVYVSFMWEWINRFRATPEFGAHLDSLFGCGEWRTAVGLTTDECRRFLYNLYKERLRASGANHVIHFDLYRGKRLVYTIFFATKSWVGADRMKKAIWAVAPLGDFAVRSERNRQIELGMKASLVPLRTALLEKFAGRALVPIEEIEEFVGSEQTDFHTGQLRKLLSEMERDACLLADQKTRKVRYTYPSGTMVQFRKSLFG